MTQTFDSWTDYDNWLIQNYDNNSIYKVEEVGGKIQIVHMIAALAVRIVLKEIFRLLHIRTAKLKR